MQNNQLSLSPKHITKILGVLAFLLILASLVGQLIKFRLGFDCRHFLKLFDISLEGNIPTFFAVLLMVVASFLLAVIAKLSSQQKKPDVSKWIVLSVGFMAMAYDEGYQVHELFIEPVRSHLGQYTTGGFYYAWVIPGIFLVLGLGLFFLRFLIRLPARNRKVFLVAGGIYIGGCIGLELVGGSFDQIHGYDNLTYNLISTIEEGLELTGLIVFIYGLTDYLHIHFGGFSVKFES